MNKIIQEIFSKKSTIVSGPRKYSIDDLKKYVKKYASQLEKYPEKSVVVKMRSDFIHVAFLLAIWMVNKTYIPMNEDTPREREKNILSSLKEDYIIVDKIDESSIRISQNNQRSQSKEINYEEDNLYIIFTSGTTGVPKGVRISEENLFTLLLGLGKKFDFDKKDMWINIHSLEFDVSIWEIIGALFYGCNLVLLDDIKNFEFDKIAKLIEENKVSILNVTPTSFFKLMPLIEQNNIRNVLFAGEKLNYQALKPLYNDKISFFNLYGITEVTIHATCHKITEEDLIEGKISNIGKGIFDNVYVNAEKGKVGEIIVEGKTVSEGYLNATKNQSERFKKDKKKVYYSGDLGREMENGDIEYIGRKDNQVEVNGHRIELTDIDNNICTLNGIRNSVTIYKDDSLKTIYQGTKQRKEYVQSSLKKLLPQYMIPQEFINVDEIPTTVNGKIDINKVISMFDKTRSDRYIAFESWLAYKLEKNINHDKSFLGIGLSSLELIDLYNEINKQFQSDREFSIVDLFQAKSIKEFEDKFNLKKR